jgi:hypothetical protein
MKTILPPRDQQESFRRVRAWLATWSDEDWSEFERLLCVMGKSDALVEMHRRKLAEQRLVEPPITTTSQATPGLEQSSLDLS